MKYRLLIYQGDNSIAQPISWCTMTPVMTKTLVYHSPLPFMLTLDIFDRANADFYNNDTNSTQTFIYPLMVEWNIVDPWSVCDHHGMKFQWRKEWLIKKPPLQPLLSEIPFALSVMKLGNLIKIYTDLNWCSLVNLYLLLEQVKKCLHKFWEKKKKKSKKTLKTQFTCCTENFPFHLVSSVTNVFHRYTVFQC